MHSIARSSVLIKSKCIEDLSVNIGVQQESVLSPLWFIIVAKIFCLWELLRTHNLEIVDTILNGLIDKFTTWKSILQSKGLLVKMIKPFLLIQINMLESIVEIMVFAILELAVSLSSVLNKIIEFINS